jgi:soluble lytic murein transglycosylase-like protein
MKLAKLIGLGVFLVALQLPAFCGEVAVLRNGFSIRFDRKVQSGETTRLYVTGGFVDVATAEIASIQPDDTPYVAAASPVAPSTSATSSSPQPVSAAPVNPAQGAPLVATAPAPLDLDQVVRDASSRHRLDPDFVNSVIKAESNFQNRAVSPKGAQGLMQLMPGTASKLGVTNAFDPKANVEGGTAYLSQLLDLYHDDPVKALAAYNAGANRVEQYHGVPPYRETRAYVARIVRDFNAKKRAQMKAAAPATKIAKKKAKGPESEQAASVSKPEAPAGH